MRTDCLCFTGWKKGSMWWSLDYWGEGSIKNIFSAIDNKRCLIYTLRLPFHSLLYLLYINNSKYFKLIATFFNEYISVKYKYFPGDYYTSEPHKTHRSLSLSLFFNVFSRISLIFDLKCIFYWLANVAYPPATHTWQFPLSLLPQRALHLATAANPIELKVASKRGVANAVSRVVLVFVLCWVCVCVFFMHVCAFACK